MDNLKLEAVSFAQTFVTMFLSSLVLALSQISPEQVLSGQVLSTAFIIAVISAAARSALKAAWQKVLPVSLGGKDRSTTDYQ